MTHTDTATFTSHVHGGDSDDDEPTLDLVVAGTKEAVMMVEGKSALALYL